MVMVRSNNLLEARYTEWKEWLDGNLTDGQVDNNSVAGVVYSIVQELAIHEAYLEICRINQTSQLATSLFFRSTIFNYFEVQAIRIRRLTEKNWLNTSTARNRDVYSLRRIVDDIKLQKKQKLITRRNICRVFSYPTTSKTTEKLFAKEMVTLRSGSFSTHLIDAANLHKTLDHVCVKSGMLSNKFIKELELRTMPEKNPNLQNIKDFVDKNIAHSSSDESRRQLNREIQLNTDAVKKATQDVVECFYILEMFIKRASYASLIPFGWDVHLNNLNDAEKNAVSNKFKEVDERCTEWRSNAYKLLNG